MYGMYIKKNELFDDASIGNLKIKLWCGLDG